MAKKRFKLMEITEQRGEVPIDDWVYGDSAAQIMSLMKMTGRNVKIMYEEDLESNPMPVREPPKPSMPRAEVEEHTKPMPPPQVESRRIQLVPAEPPKFYTIGGVDFKLENNKLYTKVWRNATEEELKNIRIISEKNNKPINLNGKIIQTTEWVISEEK